MADNETAADAGAPADVVVPDAADAADEGIAADDITPEFVPALVDTTAMVVLDGEGVVLDELTGQTHLLNPTGTLTVQCFDGRSTLDEICADLADGFGVDLETVRTDVLGLVRALGATGILQGVRATVHQHAHQETPTLPEGTVLSGLEAQVPDGPAVDDAWLTSGGSLLVSWGGRCGYCSKIVGDLADLEAPLLATGVRLMLVTTSSPEDVAAQFEQAGRSLPVAYAEELPDFFAGLGTPVAYATDAHGATVASMALGANQVPALARRAAGVDEPAAG